MVFNPMSLMEESCFKANNGYMYFGGINGFNIFHPDNIKSSGFIPKIIIDRN